MEKRMLFLDLDGTLLDDHKQITPGNRTALEGALSRGHGVIITTGRPLTSAVEQARKLGLDKPGCYLIAYNGTVIYDWQSRQELFRKDLELETVWRVFDQARLWDLHIQAYDSQWVLVEKRCDDENVRRYCGLTNSGFRVLDDIRTGLTERPGKLLLSDYQDNTELRKMESWLRENMADQVDCFFSCPEYLEVVPKGMNKGEAVKMLCGILGIPIENAVAVGDAANDLSMIVAAGIGVAMANGTEDVKTVANYVTTCDNNHDGIAEVVERFFTDPVC